MAYCTNCGALLSAGARFCRSCGELAGREPEPIQDAPRRGWPVKPDRLDKTVGLVVAAAATALYVVFAVIVPFLQGFFEGLLG